MSRKRAKRGKKCGILPMAASTHRGVPGSTQSSGAQLPNKWPRGPAICCNCSYLQKETGFTHQKSGHPGSDRTLMRFIQNFHSTLPKSKLLEYCRLVISDCEVCTLTKMNVEKILDLKFRSGWKYLTKWENCPISEATWEPISIFIEPSESPDEFTINHAFQEFAVEKHPALLDVARKIGRRLIAQSSHPPGKLSRRISQVGDDNPNFGADSEDEDGFCL